MNRLNHIPFKEIVPLSQVAFRNWLSDRAPRMGAALAYYIALSLAPTLVILAGVTGLVFGAPTAEGRLLAQIQKFVGSEGARAIQTLIEGARQPSRGIAAVTFGLLTAFIASSAVVSELRDDMNTIWGVPEDTTSSTMQSIVNLVKERLLSFIIVVASGLFLVASLIVNAGIFAAATYLGSGAAPPELLVQITDWVASFVVTTILFAFIFKVLPTVPRHWGDVIPGAVLTSLLFTAGKLLLAVYLGNVGLTDTYGTASSFVVVLIWVYYSALVLFWGAEFTRAYASRFGSVGRFTLGSGNRG